MHSFFSTIIALFIVYSLFNKTLKDKIFPSQQDIKQSSVEFMAKDKRNDDIASGVVSQSSDDRNNEDDMNSKGDDRGGDKGDEKKNIKRSIAGNLEKNSKNNSRGSIDDKLNYESGDRSSSEFDNTSSRVGSPSNRLIGSSDKLLTSDSDSKFDSEANDKSRVDSSSGDFRNRSNLKSGVGYDDYSDTLNFIEKSTGFSGNSGSEEFSGNFAEKTLSTVVKNILKTNQGRAFFSKIIRPVSSGSGIGDLMFNGSYMINSMFNVKTFGDGGSRPAICGHIVTVDYQITDLNNRIIKNGVVTFMLGAKEIHQSLDIVVTGMEVGQTRTAIINKRYLSDDVPTGAPSDLSKNNSDENLKVLTQSVLDKYKLDNGLSLGELASSINAGSARGGCSVQETGIARGAGSDMVGDVSRFGEVKLGGASSGDGDSFRRVSSSTADGITEVGGSKPSIKIGSGILPSVFKVSVTLISVMPNTFAGNNVRIFDDGIYYSEPILCGDTARFHAKITNLCSNDVIFDSKRDGKKIIMNVGDISYPIIFSHALHNKSPNSLRTVITDGSLLNSFSVGFSRIFPESKFSKEENFIIDIYETENLSKSKFFPGHIGDN